MELLIIVLNKEEHLEEILSILVELEVSGATILDSEGLGHFLAYEVPIFAGLRQLVGEKKTANRTILALVERKNFLPKFKKLLAEENIDFTQPGMGIIVTIPVNDAVIPKREIF
jgi:hypothetical protein